ncbi:hypothetical protein [Rubrobacter aplysinae]|uniref:hypothetical protein n=1 Tax=Rubrobacter aplysinae TaxID=909625 RepID=UPI00064C2B4A|nr:hypothetical protein [Rubrobacter aplysinae]
MSPGQTSRDRFTAPEKWEKVDSGGPGGFEDSRATYRLPDGSEYVWESRRHRKGLGLRTRSGRSARLQHRAPEAGKGNPWLGGFAPHRLAWWIAVVFILGSALFTLGAAASLFPPVFGGEAAELTASLAYFTGASLFTGGVYLQLLEAINSSDYIGMKPPHYTPRQFKWFAWQPRRLEFMAPFLLLFGAISFNFETALAVLSDLDIVVLPTAIALASLVGAVFFLGPSYMQMIEVCHRYLCVKEREFSWWVTFFYVVGSAGFVVGAVFGFEVPGLSSPVESLITKVTYAQGAVFFLAGSYLLLPEMYSD